ncbi:hypothetical protein S1OALGB6SA_1439 [Olavius algarvensis spirochete endosymbiont]|nr:MAG: hypothetical protein [Olavius algarvensis spirochete endosymbiont]VDB00361.1 hypothetical protein S1OALGB6SA_1439 [Olavius algarvensis spirochete endosymbiont]
MSKLFLIHRYHYRQCCLTNRAIAKAKRILLAALLSTYPIGCETEKPRHSSNTDNENLENFLPRPKFADPIPGLLNRVLLQWLEIEDADGYEIQMSATKSFNTITKMWTVKGTNLEISIPQNGTMWLRIRAFNTDVTSAWSTVLKIKETS